MTAAGSSSSCRARPRSCSGSGRTRSRRDEFRALLARTQPPGRRVLRFFGVSESAVARALADAGGDGDGVELTICARDFEIHVDVVVQPGAEARADALEAALMPPIEQWLYGRDERGVEEHVLELCRDARLHARDGRVVHRRARRGAAHLGAGSSEVVLGGVVAYADEVKRAELGVPAELLARTAPSPPRSRRRWRRARASGSAPMSRSPSPGSQAPTAAPPEKPVGLVYLHAEGPDGGLGREFSFPGRPGLDPRPLGRRRAPSRAAASDTEL